MSPDLGNKLPQRFKEYIAPDTPTDISSSTNESPEKTPPTPRHFVEALTSIPELQEPDSSQPLPPSLGSSQTRAIYISSDSEDNEPTPTPRNKGKKRDMNPPSPRAASPTSDEEAEAYRLFLEQQRQAPLPTNTSTSSHPQESTERLISPFMTAIQHVVEYADFLDATRSEDDYKDGYEAHQSDARVEFHLKVHRDFRNLASIFTVDHEELQRQQRLMLEIVSEQEGLIQRIRTHESEAARLAYHYYSAIEQGHHHQAAPNFILRLKKDDEPSVKQEHNRQPSLTQDAPMAS